MQRNEIETSAVEALASLKQMVGKSVELQDNQSVTDIVNAMNSALQRALGDCFEAGEKYVAVDAISQAWSRCYFQQKDSKISVVRDSGSFSVFTEGSARVFGLKSMFGSFFTPAVDLAVKKALSADVEKKNQTIRKDVAAIETLYFMQALICERQVTGQHVTVDMFLNKPTVSVIDGIAKVRIPHNGFRPVDGDGKDAVRPDQDLIDAVHADFTEHFPQFDELMEMVLNARFSSDRRNAFVWLHAASSFGKGLLVEVMRRLGLVCDISVAEIDKAIAGGPVGISAPDMLRTWVLHVDEWNSAKGELKNLNTSITIASKNMLRTTIPLYTKLFSSAEMVQSLVGSGVEAQFANRFSRINPPARKIDDRPLFNELGRHTYINALVWWLADMLNAGVSKFVGMGKVEASRYCDEALVKFRERNNLVGEFGSMEATIEDAADDIRQFIVEYKRLDNLAIVGSTKDQMELKRHCLGMSDWMSGCIKFGWMKDDLGNKRFGCLIANAEVFIKKYMSEINMNDRSVSVKVSHKAYDILKLLSDASRDNDGRIYLYSNKDDSTNYRKRGHGIFLDAV